MSVFTETFRELRKLCKFVGRSDRKTFNQSVEVVKMCRELQEAELKNAATQGSNARELRQIINLAEAALIKITMPGPTRNSNPFVAFSAALDKYPGVAFILPGYKWRLDNAKARDQHGTSRSETHRDQESMKRHGRSNKLSTDQITLEIQICSTSFKPKLTTEVLKCSRNDNINALLWMVNQRHFQKLSGGNLFRNPRFYSAFSEIMACLDTSPPIRPFDFTMTMEQICNGFRDPSQDTMQLCLLYDGKFSCSLEFWSQPRVFGNMWEVGSKFLMKESDGVLSLSSRLLDNPPPNSSVKVSKWRDGKEIESSRYFCESWAYVFRYILHSAEQDQFTTRWILSNLKGPPTALQVSFPEPIQSLPGGYDLRVSIVEHTSLQGDPSRTNLPQSTVIPDSVAITPPVSIPPNEISPLQDHDPNPKKKTWLRRAWNYMERITKPISANK